MKYIISATNHNNLVYDNDKNKFQFLNGEQIIFNNVKNSSEKKIHIRISLGMSCNMRCSYCSEKQNRTNFSYQYVNTREYVKSLINYIDKYFDTPYKITITFWGGEPLLYFDIMQSIHREMCNQVPDRKLEWGLSTNGKLLKGKIFRWLVDNRIQFSVSYDGPGQRFRDAEDVLQPGSVQLANLRRYLDDEQGGLAFNPVLHKGNPSLNKYEEFMQELLCCDDIPIGDAPYMRIYDDKSAAYALTEDQLQDDMADRLNRINTGKRLPNSFYSRLIRTLEAEDVPFPCITTDKEGYLAVDMKGDIWGCHNNVGQLSEENGGNLYGGNIYMSNHIDMPFIALTERREKRCPECLLRFMCGGSCGLTPSKHTDKNCSIAWYLNFPIFYQIVNFATLGERLTSVEKI